VTLIRTLNNTGSAAPARMRLGNRLVTLGDSQTIAGDTNTGNTQVRTESFGLWAQLYSKGALEFVYNAGHGGNTAAQMLARFDTDVTPYSPNIVTILSGANDGNAGVSLTSFAATIKAIVAKCTAIGAVPVLMTTPPNNYAAAGSQELSMRGYNAWLVRYANATGLPCLDVFGIVSNPAVRFNYLTVYDVGDGIHPSQAGHEAIGLALWNLLSSSITPNAELLTQYPSDPVNIITDGMMLTDNGAGRATGWNLFNTPSVGVGTPSIVTDSLVLGRMQRLQTAACVNSPYTFEQFISSSGGTKFVAGDVVRYTGIITSTGGTKAQVFLNFPGSGGFGITWYVNAPVTRGRFSIEATVPAGTTTLEPQITAGGGTGSVDFGQVTLYNLTKQGVINL
jgi:lysophospholipase L1-like esterase